MFPKSQLLTVKMKKSIFKNDCIGGIILGKTEKTNASKYIARKNENK